MRWKDAFLIYMASGNGPLAGKVIWAKVLQKQYIGQLKRLIK